MLKSFKSSFPVVFVVVVVVVCLKLLISEEPKTSGKSFISRLPIVVVIVVCLKLLLSFFSIFISSFFTSVSGFLYLLISNDPKTSGKSFISIFSTVFVVVVVVVCPGWSSFPVVFAVVVVVVCLKLAILEEPKVSGKSSISNSIFVIFIWFKSSVIGSSEVFISALEIFCSFFISAGPSCTEICIFDDGFILAGRFDWLTVDEFVCLKYLLISSFGEICFTDVTFVTFVWVGTLSFCNNFSKSNPPGTWTFVL